MKYLVTLLTVILLCMSTSVMSQNKLGYIVEDDVVRGDTTATGGMLYIDWEFYDTTGLFTIPKGAVYCAICNVGDADGIIRSGQNGTQYLAADLCINLPELQLLNALHKRGARVPEVECDATGTTFAVSVIW